VKIKRGRRYARQRGSNNVLILKLADPIIQCCIFIYFLFCLDVSSATPYRSVLLGLIGYQYVSSILNFFFKDPKVLRKERIAHLIVITCYLPLFFFMEKNVKEFDFGINETDSPYIHLFQTIRMGIALAIAFWYFYICSREVRGLLASVTKEE